MGKILPFYLMVCVLTVILFSLAADTPSGDPVPEAPGFAESFTPRQVMEAFAAAYPDRVERAGYHRGDWGVRIDGRWFLHAGGRFLPESLVFSPDEDLSRYSPWPLYRYSPALPPVRVLSESEKAVLESRLERQRDNPPVRHPGLFNALWRLESERDAYEKMKTFYFLGHKTTVHRDLLEDFARVEEDILDLARTDPTVQAYIDMTGAVTVYNYRRIAGTGVLSFHSYGLAADIVPKTYGGREAYWRWAMDRGIAWYDLPYEKRFMPPPGVIGIWEKHGFIWGGKWLFFDTIHFEYRPEILLLNGFPG